MKILEHKFLHKDGILYFGMDIKKFYQTQISLTEWYEKLGHKNASALKVEDNTKRDRLALLSDIIDLPYDKPEKFFAISITKREENFTQYLRAHGQDLCAFRLIPQNNALPKLRIRGHSVSKSLEWFDEQTIDPQDYLVEIVPHSDQPLYGTIFIVNSHGIFGEIIRGGHHQLTQGFYENVKPIRFAFDFHNWSLSDQNEDEILKHLKMVVSKIYIPDIDIQQSLSKAFHAAFSENYLHGYFETTSSVEYPLFYIDYNRILGDLYADFVISHIPQEKKNVFAGQTAYPGEVYGTARIVHVDDILQTQIEEDTILVCEMTSPDYLPIMKKVKGIATQKGGLLSHAAIICREMKIPCIVGVENLLSHIQNLDTLFLNANDGTIEKVT